jgi:hypothetical protein
LKHRPRVDAEEQGDQHDRQAADTAADRDAATPAAASGGGGAGVDPHAFVEGHDRSSSFHPSGRALAVVQFATASTTGGLLESRFEGRIAHLIDLARVHRLIHRQIREI